jgi:uncharacterized protein (DUF1330 family)
MAGAFRAGVRIDALPPTWLPARINAVACQPGYTLASDWTGGVMAGYFVANYTIKNQDEYKKYLAAVGPSLMAYGAENIVVDRDSDLLEGSAGKVTVVLRFATKDAAKAWYESPEYQAVRHLRTDNTEGIGVIAESS